MDQITNNIYSDIECLFGADRYFDEIIAIIEHIKLFEDLSNDEVMALCRYMTCYAAPRGYTLLSEGMSGDCLLLVLTGKVRVMKSISGEELESIATIGPGSTLGEMSLLDGKPRFASCITLEPTDFAVLTRAALNEILMQMPRVGNKFLLILLQIMTTRLRDTCNLFLPNVASDPPV
jgi:CRP/FNR family transcriptional regulator, cyclic AMP receptor protein